MQKLSWIIITHTSSFMQCVWLETSWPGMLRLLCACIFSFSGKTLLHIKPVTASLDHMQTLWVDPYNSLKTHQNDIIFDRGMSFEAACRKLEHEKGADDSSGFRRSRRPIFGKTMFLLALQKVGTPGVFSICRPNTGTSFFDMEVGLLSDV